MNEEQTDNYEKVLTSQAEANRLQLMVGEMNVGRDGEKSYVQYTLWHSAEDKPILITSRQETVADYLIGYEGRRDMEKYDGRTDLFTQFELAGIERSYNYVANVKLRNLLSQKTLTVSRESPFHRLVIKVNPRLVFMK